MTVVPSTLADVRFDHVRAQAALAAIDLAVARVRAAAEARDEASRDALRSADGPYADRLRVEVERSLAEATCILERLAWTRSAVSESIDEALAEQVRRELGRQAWHEAQSAYALAEVNRFSTAAGRAS